MEFRSILSIEPLPCPRPRIASRGKFAHAYYPASYKSWQAEFKELFEGADFTCFEKPVRVVATFIVERPKTTKRLTPGGDIDNYAKSLFDGLTSVGMWTDDVLIEDTHLRKRFASANESPCIELAITET